MECEECVNYGRLERIFLVCYTVCSKPDLFFVLMVKWPFQRWHGGPLLNHLGPDHFTGHDSKFHKIPVVINQPGFHRSFFFPLPPLIATSQGAGTCIQLGVPAH